MTGCTEGGWCHIKLAKRIVMVASEDGDCIDEPILFNGGPHGDIWQCLEIVLVVTTWREGLCCYWGEIRMLLNILQCTGWPPHNKELSSPKYHRTKAVKSCSTPGTWRDLISSRPQMAWASIRDHKTVISIQILCYLLDCTSWSVGTLLSSSLFPVTWQKLCIH